MANDDELSQATDLCVQLRERLAANGTMRLQTLVDMVLVELRQLGAELPSQSAIEARADRPGEE